MRNAAKVAFWCKVARDLTMRSGEAVDMVSTAAIGHDVHKNRVESFCCELEHMIKRIREEQSEVKP